MSSELPPVSSLERIPVSPREQTGRINSRVVLLALGNFAVGTDAFVVAGVLPAIAKETGITVGLAGQLVTLFSITYGVSAPLLMALTGQRSPTRVLMTALSTFCLANVASAIAPTFPLLLLTRILAGCLVAAYAPLAFAVAVQLASPERRGQALGLVAGGYTLATVLGSPLGTWVGEHFSWRMSFGLVAVLAGGAFLGIALTGLPKVVTLPPLSLSERLAPMITPRFLLALLPAWLWNLSIFMVYTYIAPLLEHNLPGEDISALLIIFGLGAVIGSWASGIGVDRLGSTFMLFALLVLLTMVEAVMSLATTTLPGAILILLVWGCSYSMLYTSQQHRLVSLANEHTNVILGLNSLTVYLGIASGAALGGEFLHVASVVQLGWIGVGCVVLAVPILLMSIHHVHMHPGSEHQSRNSDNT